MTIDRGVGLFMGVPMRTICSKRLVVLNVYTSRALRCARTSWHNEITDRISLRFYRFGQVVRAQVTALSFFVKPRLATEINLSSRLYVYIYVYLHAHVVLQDYKFFSERVTRVRVARRGDSRDCTRGEIFILLVLAKQFFIRCFKRVYDNRQIERAA